MKNHFVSLCLSGLLLPPFAARSFAEDSINDGGYVQTMKKVSVAYNAGETWNAELSTTIVDRHSHMNQSTAQFVPAGYATVDLLAHAKIDKHMQLHATGYQRKHQRVGAILTRRLS